MITWLLVGLAVAYGLWRTALGYSRPDPSYERLTRGEAAFLAAAAEAAYPPGGAIASSGLDADLPRYADRLLAASQPRIRRLMHGLFFLVEHATLFFPAPGRGGMRRFSSLGPEQRIAVLEGWRRSRFFPRRLVFTSLRAILTMGYFAHPPVLCRLGLAPLAIESPVCEADLLYPRVGRHPDTIPYTRADLTEPSDGTPLDAQGPLQPDCAEGRP